MRAADKDTDLVLKYGEPAPEAVGPMIANVIDEGIGINKILLFCDEKDMPALREDAELMFENDCAITTAVPGMLEFLPMGASKGAARARLLDRLGVDPKNVLALGDGENDAEMLALAGTAVAMKGSAARVVDAARGVVGGSNDEDGVADAVEKYVLAARVAPCERNQDAPGGASRDLVQQRAAPAPMQIKTRSIAAAAKAAAQHVAEEKEQKKLAQEMEKAKHNGRTYRAARGFQSRDGQARAAACLAAGDGSRTRLSGGGGARIGSIREKDPSGGHLQVRGVRRGQGGGQARGRS